MSYEKRVACNGNIKKSTPKFQVYPFLAEHPDIEMGLDGGNPKSVCNNRGFDIELSWPGKKRLLKRWLGKMKP